jgi:site-specific DNA recombinase
MTDHRNDHQDLAGLRYAAYIRVSMPGQTRGLSLKVQEEGIQAWAEENGLILATWREATGATIPAIFHEVFTGTRFERPELDRVRQLAENGLIDAVVVHRVDRFARDEAVFLLLQRYFEKLGVRLFSVEEGEFTPGQGNQLLISSQRASAQAEISLFKKRAHGTARNYIRHGIVNPSGIGPFGYLKVGKGRGIQLVRIPEEGKIVILIFELYPARGLNAIASHLTRLSIPAPSKQRGMKKPGSGKWSAQMVRKILMNPVYIGRWTTYDYIDGQKGLSQEQRQKMGAPEIVVEVEPTVQLELWERAQKALAARKEEFTERWANQERQQFYLLSSLVRCLGCKRSMHATSTPQDEFGRVYRYYQCGKCKTRAPGNIDDRVWRFVCELLGDAEELVTRYRQARHQASGRYAETRDRIAAVDQLLDEHGRKREHVLQLFRHGQIDDERLERELLDLRRVMEGLQQERRRWQRVLDEETDDESEIEELYRLAQTVQQLGDDGDDERRREVVERLGLTVRLERHDKSGAHKPRITLYAQIQANVWRLNPDGAVEDLGEQPLDIGEVLEDTVGRQRKLSTLGYGNWIAVLRKRRME